MKIERHCLRVALYLLTVIPFAAAMSQGSGGTLERVAKTGEFRIGYRTDASPLSYENAEGEPSGYSVDLCRRIATAVKSNLGLDRFELKFVPIASDDRIDAVASGKVDIECDSTTVCQCRAISIRAATSSRLPIVVPASTFIVQASSSDR